MENILNYKVSGSGPPVLLLHGMVGSGRYWVDIVKILQKDHQVITLDLLGFGESLKPKNSQYTTDDHIKAITTTLDYIGVRKPVTIVGHSMGAILAVSLAKKYPDYSKNLVLISLPLYQNAHEARREITNSNLVPKMMYYGLSARAICTLVCQVRPLAQRAAPHFLRHVPKDVAIDATKHTWQSYSKTMTHVIENQSVLSDIANVKIPIIAVFGASDSVARLEKQTLLQKANKNISITTLEGSHQLPLQIPEKIAQLITDSTIQ